MSVAKASRSPDGGLAVALANMVVAVYRQHTGRGPSRSRTHISDDLIAVVLEDTLTTAERTLATNGKTDVLLAGRRAFQDTMRQELVAGIETRTGRKVIAAFSDSSIEPDVTIESFLLAPKHAATGAVGTEPTIPPA